MLYLFTGIDDTVAIPPPGGIYYNCMKYKAAVKDVHMSNSMNAVCADCNSNASSVIKRESHALKRRLAIIEGQVRGLSEMVERGDYCIDIITQASAIKQALSNIEDILLEEHLGRCVAEQMASGQSSKAVEEIIKVYRLKRK